MPLPLIYVEKICPLEGYEDLRVRVLANATDAVWSRWVAGNLGTPGCEGCAELATPPTPAETQDIASLLDAAPPPPADPSDPRLYCAACQAARDAYGESIVLLYGPTLAGEDVSTPAAALALFDRDDALPSEIVIWLQILPAVVRNARTEELLLFTKRSSTTAS